MSVAPTLIKSTQWLCRTRISKCNTYANKVFIYFILLLFLMYRSLTTLFSPSRSPFLTPWRRMVWEWHKRSLRLSTRLQRESAINAMQCE